MIRRSIAVLILAAAALAGIACGGGDSSAPPAGASPTATAGSMATPTVGASPAAMATAQPRSNVLGQVLMQALQGSGGPSSQGAGELGRFLLRPEELPGYQMGGEFTYMGAADSPAAARVFVQMDAAQVGRILIALAVQPSAELLPQIRQQLGAGVSDREAEMLARDLGVQRVEVSQPRGLGEQAVAVRMRLEPGMTPTGRGGQMEGIFWLRNNRLLTLMSVYAEGTMGPDLRELAGIMDRRAQGS